MNLLWQWILRYDIKSSSNKRQKDKLDHVRIKKLENACASKTLAKVKKKKIPQNGRKYFQVTYLIRNFYLK